MRIQLFNKKGETAYTIPVGDSSTYVWKLQSEEYISVVFSSGIALQVKKGFYTDIDGLGRFEIVTLPEPTASTKGDGYDYELRMDRPWAKFKNRMIYLQRGSVLGMESKWSLTDTIESHCRILTDNLTKCGFNYKGDFYHVALHKGVDTEKSVLIDYDATSLLDALGKIASAFDCEWWIVDDVIHFGRCEAGDSETTLTMHKEIASLSRSEDSDQHGTRLYAFGSSRNLNQNYRRKLKNPFIVNGWKTIYESTVAIKTSKPKTWYSANGVLEIKTGHYQGQRFPFTIKSGTYTSSGWTDPTFEIELPVLADNPGISTGDKVQFIIGDATTTQTDDSLASITSVSRASYPCFSFKDLALPKKAINGRTTLALADGTGEKGITFIGVVYSENGKSPLNDGRDFYRFTDGSQPKTATEQQATLAHASMMYVNKLYTEPVDGQAEVSVQSYSENVLQLPIGTPYIDSPGLDDDDEIVEVREQNEDIYPRALLTIDSISTIDAKETDEDTGAVTNWKAYRFTAKKHDGTPFYFDNSYLINEDSKPLSIHFESGNLSGLEFEVYFNPEAKNGENRLFEITRNSNYKLPMPNETACPQVGDTLYMFNMDADIIDDELVTVAEQELKTWAEKEMVKICRDSGTYTATINPVEWGRKKLGRLQYGQKVKLNAPHLVHTDDGTRSSRIIAWELKLQDTTQGEYTIGESSAYSTSQQLSNDVQELIYYNGQIRDSQTGDGSSRIYDKLIGKLQTKTDSLDKELKTKLSKVEDDTTPHKLTMGEAEVKGALTVGGDASVSGKVVTDDIHSSDSDGNTSMTGKGWTLRNVSDETGSYSVLAVDNIVVRKKMEAAELEIHRKTYVGAQQIASDWGHKILRVDPVSMDYETGEVSSLSGLTLFTLPVTVDGVERPVAFVGRALSDTETRVELLGDGKGVLNRELETTANAFKVYFCESDGTTSIEDDLVVGSMGQCQEFNVKARVTHNFKNTYYWGVCVKHGVEDNVLIGGKATKCVYGVFAHTTELITLTSEVSKKTFTCYGMEQAGCTFPVAGDDMVGFGCADPWQDADRCNAIITASKDGEKSAPSVIAYSGIGRKRGGAIEDLSADKACKAYAGIEEQYSVPSAKDDSRLDFRVSKKAGNVFKGDLYFKGSDENGTLQPVRESETTSVWQLVPVTEKAEIDYSINKDAYKSYQDATLKGTAQNGDAAENGSAQNHADAAAKVFVKKGEVLLKYYILCQKGEGSPVKYETMPNNNLRLTVTAYSESGYALYSFSSSDKNSTYDTKLHDKLSFEDDQATNVSRLSVNLLDNNGKIVDRREVRMKLNTNGVFEANKDFLTYIYYGTDGKGGARYTNQRISTMQGNFTDLTKRVEGAEGNINTNTQKITETATKYERVLEQETKDRKEGDQDLKTSIEATAAGIKTTVKSLYTEGNLLTGGDVKGSRAKRYQAYESPVTTHLRKGITYTVTARMWMEAKKGYPTQPKMDGHYITMFVYTKDWNTDSVWSDSYTYTKSGTVVDSFSFTPKSDIDVLVGIYEQISTGGPDPKEYGGVSVDWVRLDMGDMTGKNQITKWTPSAGDVETLNLIPDPNFEVASWETTDGASSRGTQGGANDVSFMSRYTADYDDYGFRGVRMTRSGYTGKDANTYGLIYWIPFRGEGDYTAQAFIKDLDGVTLEDAVYIDVHPADVNKSRICWGFSIGMFRQTTETGYFRTSRTYHFGKTATNASTGEEQEIQWLEVRVFLARNGDVVVSRLSLAKCGHAVHWNADALGSENGKMLSMESYAYQRAGSMGAGIRKGLQSVGFRMDSASWSVKTWGDQFAWYATEEDANAGTEAKMWLDTNTNTLHVKGYVEATGGTFNGTVKADLLYGKTMDITETTDYEIDPSTSPATCFLYRDPSVGVHYIILPKASDYDGLEIQVFFLCTKPLTRAGFPFVYIRAKDGETLYAKESVKAGTKDSNGHTPYIMDLNTGYTAYNGNNTWCFLARNNLNRFKSMGGNWYAIDGYFGNIY